MRTAVTIYDVARKAEISIATVSRVMNCPEKVSLHTKEKVLRVMEELDFTPKLEASLRARGQFKRVGIITPFAHAYSFVQRVRGVTSSLPASEFEVITYSVENKKQLDNYLTMLPGSNRVDGVIIISLPVEEKAVQLFQRFQVPLVTIEASLPAAASVTIDNVEGGQVAARYLLKTGYRVMGFLGDASNPGFTLQTARRRLKGFSQVLADAGLPIRAEHTVFHPFGLRGAYSAAENLLSKKTLPDAVFAASDYEAMVFLKVARDLGLKVPVDVAVLGFDNIELTDILNISTIDQHLDDSGRLAAKMLVEAIGTQDYQQERQILLYPEPVERGTT